MEHTKQQFSVNPRYSMAVAWETVWHIVFGENNVLAVPGEGDRCKLFAC